MRNKLLFIAIVLLLLVSAVTPAAAGYVWCATDPNILIPGEGIVHLIVGVPQEYQGVSFVLDVWAPAGARVVGDTHGINVVLHEGPAKQITAAENAGFPVMMAARYKGQLLAPGVVYFLEGSGSATWTW
jgi:type 1 fimbria pilin